jgi:hypothetical protein
MASKALTRALKDLPEAVRAVILKSETEAAKRIPKSTGSMAADLLTYPSPAARAVAAKASKTVAGTARTVDEAAGAALRKTPGVGGLFEKKKSITLKEYAGGTKVRAEVPMGSAVEPARKAGRVAVPILAVLGYESLANPEMKEPKMAGCNHEPILAEAGQMLRQLQAENEILVDKVAHLQMRNEAERVVGQAVDDGLIPEEDRSTKVAEITSGQTRLDVVKQAMSFRGVMPKIGELESGPDDVGDSSVGTLLDEPNETLDYLLTL